MSTTVKKSGFEFDVEGISASVNRPMGVKPGNENDPVSPAQAGKLARLLVAGVKGYEYPENAYSAGVAIPTQAIELGDITVDQLDMLTLVPDTHRALATMILVVRGRGGQIAHPATKAAASELIAELEGYAVKA